MGVGGTLVWYAVIFALGRVADLGWPDLPYPTIQNLAGYVSAAMFFPLIPGSIPCVIGFGILRSLGAIGKDLDLSYAFYPCLWTAPVVHAFFVYFWLRRRHRLAGYAPNLEKGSGPGGEMSSAS